MADRGVDVLIVGGGAGGRAVRRGAARGGFDGSILLVGPRARPAVRAPAVLQGLPARASPRARTRYLHPAAWWAEHDVELLTRTSVMKLDTGGAQPRRCPPRTSVALRARALLATGANVRRLRVDGGELEGIHYLRDARQLRRDPRATPSRPSASC